MAEKAALTVSEAKAKFSELINRAAYGHERIVVGSHGKPKVAIISIEDLDRLEDLEDAQSVREGLEEEKRGELIPWEEARAMLDEGGDEIPD
jgi:prevent-host-death family protein